MAENLFTEEWLAQRLQKPRKPKEPQYEANLRLKASDNVFTASALAKGFDPFLALCAAHGLPEPQTEYRFHPTRQFKADYAWPDQKLIVERQGGLFSSDERAKRAHAMPLKILRDYEKSNLAQLAGWTYLQFTPEQLDKGLMMTEIKIRLGL